MNRVEQEIQRVQMDKTLTPTRRKAALQTLRHALHAGVGQKRMPYRRPTPSRPPQRPRKEERRPRQ
jgi:hypothetical protein